MSEKPVTNDDIHTEISETEFSVSVQTHEQLNIDPVTGDLTHPCVTVKVRLPYGSESITFPFFKRLRGKTARLERVVIHSSQDYAGVAIVGIYNESDLYVTYVHWVGDDLPEIHHYDHYKRGRPRHTSKPKTVLWDALWDDTLDPLHDVKLNDNEYDGPERERPWDDD